MRLMNKASENQNVKEKKTQTTTTNPVWGNIVFQQPEATFDKNRARAAAGARGQGAGVPTIISIKKQ